jgi:serine protease Do
VPLNPQSREEGSGVDWYDSGIGFAVPIGGNEKVIEALKAGKTLQPAFLGVQSEPRGTPAAGAHIVQVVPKSPAETAGIKANDQIKAIDGNEILDVTHMQSIIARYNAGDKATISLQRGEEKLDVTAEFAVPPVQAKPTTPGKRPMTPPMPMPEKPKEEKKE